MDDGLPAARATALLRHAPRPAGGADLRFGRELLGDPALRESEWLVANGIGGYASGSVIGLRHRAYHGLLVAALTPPTGRRVLVPALVETVVLGDRAVELSALRWRDGTLAPDPGAALTGFALQGTGAVWRYQTGWLALERRLWMDHGANVTRIAYRLLQADGPVRLRVQVLTDARDYHGRSFAGDWLPEVQTQGDRLTARYGAVTVHARLQAGQAVADPVWWRGIDLASERARGLTDTEDHVRAGLLEAPLPEGKAVQLVLSTDGTGPDPEAWPREQARAAGLLAGFADAPGWVQRLALAADQFIVRRALRDGTPGHSVLAGYHWFADWGRDTMIALPGLALVTGRASVARSILRAFADVIADGLVPNRFPDAGDVPEFNSVDATLWYIEAVAALDRTAPDDAFLAGLFPVLEGIFAHLRDGTRFGIALDPADGLIRAGVPGMQLTWMDARVNGREVTPRIGKPVEVNALWVSGLRFMAGAAARLGRDPAPYAAALAAALAGFGRYWNPARGFLFDVLDGPAGHEDALRPNQILACRAATGALPREQALQVLAVCAERLWTPCGLRSLAEGEAGYLPHYGGPAEARDGAYHMGTVWAWLIGPFIEAHLDLHADPAAARRLLEPLADQLRIGGLGTVGEIFEAAPPHAPRGCIAQAWSVGEILRAWSLIAAHPADGESG